MLDDVLGEGLTSVIPYVPTLEPGVPWESYDYWTYLYGKLLIEYQLDANPTEEGQRRER